MSAIESITQQSACNIKRELRALEAIKDETNALIGIAEYLRGSARDTADRVFGAIPKPIVGERDKDGSGELAELSAGHSKLRDLLHDIRRDMDRLAEL